MAEVLSIAGHGIDAQFAPAYGGLTVAARHNGWPLLYTPADPALRPGTIHYFGNWPLAPFANRAFKAKLRFGGETWDLPANDPESPGSTLHGFSWQAPWEVTDRARDKIVMHHRQTEPAGPYRYSAMQTVAATPQGFVTDLAIVNEADRSLPYGLGLHPWFPREADTEVSYKAARVLTLGEDYQPLAIAGPDAGTDFSTSRRLDADRETAIQFCQGDSRAAITYPSRGFRIAMRWDNADCPMFWSPVGAPFLCLEPQTHAMGAPSEPIAHEAGPLALLAPGQSLAIRLTLAADAL